MMQIIAARVDARAYMPSLAGGNEAGFEMRARACVFCLCSVGSRVYRGFPQVRVLVLVGIVEQRVVIEVRLL